MAKKESESPKNKSQAKSDNAEDKAVVVHGHYLTPTTVVRDAVENAELLLMHTSESGLELTPEEIKVITEAKRALENDNWTSEMELEFWLVYRKLASRSYPVTVDAVRAAQETKIKNPNLWQRMRKKYRRNTLAYRSVRFYTVFTIVTLIVMVILHVTFSIGSIRLNRIQVSDERLKEIEQQIDEIEQMMPEGTVNTSAELKKDRLLNEMYEVNSEKESNIKLLEDWLRAIKTVTFSRQRYEERLKKTSVSDEMGLPAPPSSPEESIDIRIEIIQEAQNYVLILGLYILPLFYGLLGAMTFVLRDLAYRTKHMLFTKESNITYTLRLILGTIAGLAVGVFWGDLKQQEEFVFIQSLGPLLVAFLAGLTVEYLFSAIERWISSIIEKTLTDKPKKAQ